MWWSKKNNRIYLDWASAAPVYPRAQKVFNEALSLFGNPSSPHKEGVAAKSLLESSRTRIARLAGVKASHVVFTSGATESNALAIMGRVEKCLEEGKEYRYMQILYLPTMHSSVLKSIQVLSKRGVHTMAIPLKNGAIDLLEMEKLLTENTVLVTVDAVCGETGTRFDTLSVRRSIDAKKISQQCLVHVDASQLPLVESIERTHLGADLMSLDAQKVGGIRGVGALIGTVSEVSPLIYGGGQEQGIRPGTEPVALISAFAEALAICEEKRKDFHVQATAMKITLLSYLEKKLPQACINSSRNSVPHILNISFPGLDTDYAVMLLDAEGYGISTRSACETDATDGSAAVYSLTNDTERALATLRISWGPTTTHDQLMKFAHELTRTIRFLENARLI